MANKCLKETRDVLKYEGEDAFLSAFEKIGELAMLTLMEDKNVVKGMERYIQYIDQKSLEKIFK